jgi:cyclic pyranopterin phosphate synthase
MTPYDASPAQAINRSPRLIDGFGRAVTYLRVSVTDRCDLRCTYCMAEHMTFLPKAEVLSLEELDRLATAFVDLGVRKLRLTGGEPLVRKGIMTLVERLSRHLATGALDELTLTTNGTQLAGHAADLARLGVRRVNVSLDTLKPDLFRKLTRGGDLTKVLAGIDAALAAGIQVKINAVALKHDNAQELPALIQWAHGLGADMTLIETMPLGEVEVDRTDQYLSLKDVRRRPGRVLDPDRPGLRHRRSGPLCPGRGDRRATGPDHSAQPQFLRGLQSGAPDLHRHPAHVPGPRRRQRPTRRHPGRGRRRGPGTGHLRGDRGQASGP